MKTMKILFLFAALALSAVACAEEANDTTFNVKDKKIVVDVQDDRTIVKVYNKEGYRLSKTREMEFIDGQEVEQVYVGSPLIPAENLQNFKFRSYLPTIWYGFSCIGNKVCSDAGEGVHGRERSRSSFEIGVTPWSFAVPFNDANTLGVMGGVQLLWSHVCFDKNYAVSMQGDRFAYTPLDKKASGNNMNFGVLRIPVLLSMQRNFTETCVNFGLSFEMRTNAAYRFSPAAGTVAPDVPKGLKLNRFGLNLDFSLAFGFMSFNATMGLTPLFKTVTGDKAFYTSANIGINLGEMIRFCKGDKKKK